MSKAQPGARIPVRNPRTGRTDTHLEAMTADAVARLVTEARANQSNWLQRGLAGRIDALRRFGRAVEAHGAALAAALEQDTGRRSDSDMEVRAVLEALEHWCTRAPRALAPLPASATALPHVRAQYRSMPCAVVAAIAPWNFPLLLSFLDTIPALLAGCSVVVKPSEVTPRFVAPLRRALAAVPALAEVLHFAHGGASVGAELVQQADCVCFTGSVATGRKVAAAAAARLVPAHLELGGKDPAIIFADADLDRAAAAVCWGATSNAGQSCLSIERIYVEHSVFGEFVERLVAAVRALRLTCDDPGKGQIGPVIAASQVAVLERHLDDAVARGASVLCGGRLVEAGGVWCQPTVLTDVSHAMLVMREETFGPLLPVMPFADEAAAVALANDSTYGLSAAVFSADAARLERVALALEVGAVSANDVGLTSLVHDGVKQAVKSSGLGGSRMGDSAFERFYRRGVVLTNTSNAWQPWWSFGGDSAGE